MSEEKDESGKMKDEGKWRVCWRNLADGSEGHNSTPLEKYKAENWCAFLNAEYPGIAEHWIEEAPPEEVPPEDAVLCDGGDEQ